MGLRHGARIQATPRLQGRPDPSLSAQEEGQSRGRRSLSQTQLLRWPRNIAGTRIHGTTGEQPLLVFETVERAALKPLPAMRFKLVVWRHATVRDAYVSFDGRLYSVPFRLSGSELWLQATPKSVVIYADDTRVATHNRKGPSRRSTVEAHLPEGRRDLRFRDRGYWEQRADALGAEVGSYIREVFDSDDVLSRLCVVQAMVLLLERVPIERARAGCQRAAFYGHVELRALRTILAERLEEAPLPVLVVPDSAEVSLRPRFARRLSELWDTPVEVTHEPH